MATQPSYEEIKPLEQRIFEAARDGRVKSLCSTLSKLSPELSKDVLHHFTRRKGPGHFQPWEETPLSIAAYLGHLDVVKLLVEDFNVDLDQRVAAEPIYGKNVTALMMASESGHLDIAELLVTNGCDVNLANGRGETALYLACVANRVELVKFLVENGAKIDDDHRMDRLTCLMAACQEGSLELVEYLLEKGANVNKQTDRKVTALHIAAGENAVKKVKTLLKNGAMMSSSSEDRSPLMEAAWMHSKDVVNFFVKSSYVKRKEKINSLELLGARMVTQDPTVALGYLCQAMKMRHEDPCDIIPKPHSVLPAPSNVVESRTLEELEARGLDPGQLRLECLAIAGRVLNPRSISFTRFCLEHALNLDKSGHLNEALTVLLHALEVKGGFGTTENGNFRLATTIFADILSCVMRIGHVPRFSSLCKVLELSVEILQQNQPASQCLSEYFGDFADMCLLCVSVCLDVAKGQEEMAMLQKLTKSLIHLQPSSFRGGSVLHAAVSTGWELFRHDILLKDLQVNSLISFLLQCDADVNAMDNNRNRPLHILAKCPEKYFDAETLSNLTHSLVEAGAPVFVLNGEGQTPLDIAVTEEMASILREFYPASLQSLSASAAVKHGIPYTGQVPEIVEEFLQRH